MDALERGITKRFIDEANFIAKKLEGKEDNALLLILDKRRKVKDPQPQDTQIWGLNYRMLKSDPILEDMPQPLTIGEALELMKSEHFISILAKRWCENIRFTAKILSPPHLLDLVLANAKVIAEWPWPKPQMTPMKTYEKHSASWEMISALRSLAHGKDLNSQTYEAEQLAKWIPEHAPIDVAHWFDEHRAQNPQGRIMGYKTAAKTKKGGLRMSSPSKTMSAHLQKNKAFPEVHFNSLTKEEADVLVDPIIDVIEEANNDVPLEELNKDGIIDKWAEAIRVYALPPYAMALLYEANLQAEYRSPLPPVIAIASVNDTAMIATRAVAGVNTKAIHKDSKIIQVKDADSTIVAVKIIDRKDKAQLTLPMRDGIYGLDADDPTFKERIYSHVTSEYGFDAVKALICCQTFAWMNRANAGQDFWIWVDEVIHMFGRKENKENRRKVRDIIRRMSEVDLKISYKSGDEHAGPLVNVNEVVGGKRGEEFAFQIRVHQYIYNGIQRADGKPGTNFAVADLGLLSVSNNSKSKHAIMLAISLLEMFKKTRYNKKHKKHFDEGGSIIARMRLGPTLDRMCITKRQDRKMDSYALEQLNASIDTLKEHDLISQAKFNGDAKNLDTMIEFTAGGITADVMMGKPMPRVSHIPSTMGELDEYIQKGGFVNQQELADMLGISLGSLRQMRKTRKNPNELISRSLRGAFTDFAWSNLLQDGGKKSQKQLPKGD